SSGSPGARRDGDAVGPLSGGFVRGGSRTATGIGEGSVSRVSRSGGGVQIGSGDGAGRRDSVVTARGAESERPSGGGRGVVCRTRARSISSAVRSAAIAAEASPIAS